MRFWLVMILAATMAGPSSGTPRVLENFEECVLVPREWADGDSFSVRLPDERELTVRLYAVDCIEMHIAGDDTNARRLRDQRRYFGIPNAEVARGHGEVAKHFVEKELSRPFVLHTAFADARGDGRFVRVYGFITTADGRDLGEKLVAAGLARAFGVNRSTFDAVTAREYAARLTDLELTAAREGRGAWADTDWSRIAEERRNARAEAAEIESIKGRAPLDQPLDPNTAARDELMRLPSIGEVMANRIIETRERVRFREPEDLLEVPGIGRATLETLRPHLVFGAEN